METSGNNNSILNDSRTYDSNNTTNSHNVDNHSVDNHSVSMDDHSVDNHSVDSHNVVNHHGLSMDEALKLAQTLEQEKQKAREEARIGKPMKQLLFHYLL